MTSRVRAVKPASQLTPWPDYCQSEAGEGEGVPAWHCHGCCDYEDDLSGPVLMRFWLWAAGCVPGPLHTWISPALSFSLPLGPQQMLIFLRRSTFRKRSSAFHKITQHHFTRLIRWIKISHLKWFLVRQGCWWIVKGLLVVIGMIKIQSSSHLNQERLII